MTAKTIATVIEKTATRMVIPTPAEDVRPPLRR